MSWHQRYGKFTLCSSWPASRSAAVRNPMFWVFQSSISKPAEYSTLLLESSSKGATYDAHLLSNCTEAADPTAGGAALDDPSK